MIFFVQIPVSGSSFCDLQARSNLLFVCVSCRKYIKEVSKRVSTQARNIANKYKTPRKLNTNYLI